MLLNSFFLMFTDLVNFLLGKIFALWGTTCVAKLIFRDTVV